MKIACITQVRDECDIIELFARINCRIFDHIYIIDNNSVDTTPHILEKLKTEGLPISTTFDGDNTYNQDGLVTSAMRSINMQQKYDWFMFLDADEFLDETKEDILEKLENTPRNRVPKALWRSWVPTDLTYFQHKAPLYSMFNALQIENHITYKAIIDRGRAPNVRITHGNHEWKRLDNGLIVPDHYCGIRINHFPVRNEEQMVSKVVLNHYRQLVRSAVKQNKTAELGKFRSFFQLAAIHTELQQSNYLVTKESLRRWAVWYNTEIPPTGKDPQIDSAIPNVGFGFEDDVIQWPELSRIALGSRFDKQMDIMQGAILKMHKKLREFGVMI